MLISLHPDDIPRELLLRHEDDPNSGSTCWQAD
jgi:hypothetical protein